MNRNLIEINQYFSYFPSSENPLSAEVFFIEGINYNYIFDVGANEESLQAILSEEKRIIILSHFHQDHGTNIRKIEFEKLYVDKKSRDYYDMGEVVEERLQVEDGVKLEIIPVKTSHSKTGLLLNINEEYLLTGDALYMSSVNGRRCYNAQLLKETITCLRNTKTKKIILSHDRQLVYSYEETLQKLEEIYAKREKNNPYIYLD